MIKTTLKRLGIVFLLFLAYSYAEYMVLVPTLRSHGRAGTLVVAGLFTVVFGILLLLLWRTYQWFLSKEDAAHWHRKPLDLKMVGFEAVMVLLMYGVQIVGGLLQSHGATGEPANQSSLMAIMEQAPLAMTLIACVGGPAVEELLFRGLLMHSFPHQEKISWRVVAVVLSSMVFGLAHTSFTDPLNWAIYSALGGVFALTYAYTGDIRYSMFLHFLNNLAALML